VVVALTDWDLCVFGSCVREDNASSANCCGWLVAEWKWSDGLLTLTCAGNTVAFFMAAWHGINENERLTLRRDIVALVDVSNELHLRHWALGGPILDGINTDGV
jgi:hypothetical protein